MLACLEGTSMKAQQALESGTNVKLAEAKNLNAYFQKAGGGGMGRWRAAKRFDLGILVKCGTPCFKSCAVGCVTLSVLRPQPPLAGQGDDGQV